MYYTGEASLAWLDFFVVVRLPLEAGAPFILAALPFTTEDLYIVQSRKKPSGESRTSLFLLP
jgi:hypothetical protein